MNSDGDGAALHHYTVSEAICYGDELKLILCGLAHGKEQKVLHLKGVAGWHGIVMTDTPLTWLRVDDPAAECVKAFGLDQNSMRRSRLRLSIRCVDIT